MISPGQQFGLYVIKDVLQADVEQASCIAEDPFFNREVTLKTFSEEHFLDSDKLMRLEELLERLAVLDHPSIAPIYDFGREEGCFYYTSVCNVGKGLAESLKEPLPAEKALKIIYELTQALEYALEHELGQNKISAENVHFDENGRALLLDFGLAEAVMRLQLELSGEAAIDEPQGSVEVSLRSLGELLLQMLLGYKYNAEERIDDLCAGIENAKVRGLVGRFLLPGEWRFATFSELLDELKCFDELSDQLESAAGDTPVGTLNYSDTEPPAEAAVDEQTEQMVAEVRRLVAEKNTLQQKLDKALFNRNQADNKLTEGERKLALLQKEIVNAKEEADVAWELVAGQKYDRWRPVTWAVGGFVIGFLLSGSYGYYYSEQTRNELLAKLKANEDLIKTAAWRPAEQQSQVAQPQPKESGAQTVAAAKPNSEDRFEGLVTEVEAEQEARLAATVEVVPVAEETNHWWPAGSEFSAAAAIPIEQIKAALGLNSTAAQEDLSDSLRNEVMTTVSRWAQSWSSQDLTDYFSFYSEAYRPELGRSQEEWRQMRRSRLTRPQWIKLDIDDIRVRKVDENRVQVKLKQSYRSDFYQDEIFKSINLIKEDGEWRILMERSLGMVGSSDIVGG